MPSPGEFPRITPALFYENAAKAIDWLCSAFGFEVMLKIEGKNGRIEHSELAYRDGVIMVGEARSAGPRDASHRRSPREIAGGNTQSVMVMVDDADAHHAHARAAGAKIVTPPATSDHGEEYWSDRSYEVEDLEGHHWWFIQRLRGPKK